MNFIKCLPIVLGVFFSVNCFADTETVCDKLNRAYYYYTINEMQNAIDLLDTYIEDENIPDMDKVHYIIARSTFHLKIGRADLYHEDFNLLHELCSTDIFCYYELVDNYPLLVYIYKRWVNGIF